MKARRHILLYNMDLIILLLNILVSHKIVGSPLLGASVFLFSNILFLSRHDTIKKIIILKKNFLLSIIYFLSLFSSVVSFIFFPKILNFPYYISLVFFAINLLVICIRDKILKKSIELDSRIIIGNENNSSFSLEIFQNMMFYSRISLKTGLFMIISYICFKEIDFSLNHYLLAVISVFSVEILYVVFSNSIKPNITYSTFIFIFGGLLWILSCVLFFKDSSFVNILSMLIISVSLALFTAALSRFNKDFGLILNFIGESNTNEWIKGTESVIVILSSLISNCLMLLVITVWLFLIPDCNKSVITDIYPDIVIQIPVLFMLISIYYALNYPLDYRTRDKLQHYLTTSGDNAMRLNLYRILIKKYRVRYGVKIIATFVRPFLHLKVIGKENIKSDNFPSVFVCNHGIIYGPIAAVIYLPTYFRPWIDKKMLDIKLSSEEMYERLMYRIPLVGERFKKIIAKCLSYPVVWAMNSFNPIGVERDNLRQVMTTFNDTIAALKESDNILLFPERPAKKVLAGKETVIHSTDSVGNLFKGFAKLGDMYWKETGRCLSFYPIYADKAGKTFKIGEAVVYEPTNNVNDERDRIASELKCRMDTLSKGK